jgi:hypothetical protein
MARKNPVTDLLRSAGRIRITHTTTREVPIYRHRVEDYPGERDELEAEDRGDSLSDLEPPPKRRPLQHIETPEVIRVETVIRHHVLFGGSYDAWVAWRAAHYLAPDAMVELPGRRPVAVCDLLGGVKDDAP